MKKENKMYDELKIIGITNIVIAWLMFILTMLNVFLIKNNYLREFIYGSEFTIIGICLVRLCVLHHNGKILDKKIKELENEFSNVSR